MLSAILGAGYAALCILFPQFSGIILRLICAAVMVAAAFGIGSVRKFTYRCLLMGLCSVIFGGFVLLLTGLGTTGLRMTDGVLYASVPGIIVAALCIGAYILLTSLLRFSVQTAEQKPKNVCVHIAHNDQNVEFTALYDTGNRLRDPTSGERVLVCDIEVLRNLLDPAVTMLFLTQTDAPRFLHQLDKRGLARGFHLIPYHAVGVSHGLLAAFRPQQIRIDGKPYRDIVVALTQLPDEAQYRAILGV